jgi:hypothetical protein
VTNDTGDDGPIDTESACGVNKVMTMVINHLILLLHLSCAGDSGLTSHESQALDNKP